MEKEKLQEAIRKVNSRYLSGLNDDDAVAAMIAIEQKILGWTFAPRYDTYELISEVDRAVEIMKSKPGFEMKPQPLSYYIDKLRERLVEKAGTPYANKTMLQALEIMGCISVPA